MAPPWSERRTDGRKDAGEAPCGARKLSTPRPPGTSSEDKDKGSASRLKLTRLVVKADGEAEQELYDKFKCWCKKVPGLRARQKEEEEK